MEEACDNSTGLSVIVVGASRGIGAGVAPGPPQSGGPGSPRSRRELD